jgi:16S rRNA processing protein RimM
VGKNDFLLVGKIVGTHGLQGNVKVLSFAESCSLFKPGGSVLVKSTPERERMFEIRWAAPHAKTVLMALKGVDSRGLAESLVGSELFIDKAVLPELEEDTFYWSDIIGLSVFTIEEEYLGSVDSIIETGSNDVYVVKNRSKDQDNEVLVPALESVVIEIDLKRKLMRVDLPEGL